MGQRICSRWRRELCSGSCGDILEEVVVKAWLLMSSGGGIKMGVVGLKSKFLYVRM